MLSSVVAYMVLPQLVGVILRHLLLPIKPQLCLRGTSSTISDRRPSSTRTAALLLQYCTQPAADPGVTLPMKGGKHLAPADHMVCMQRFQHAQQQAHAVLGLHSRQSRRGPAALRCRA